MTENKSKNIFENDNWITIFLLFLIIGNIAFLIYLIGEYPPTETLKILKHSPINYLYYFFFISFLASVSIQARVGYYFQKQNYYQSIEGNLSKSRISTLLQIQIVLLCVYSFLTLPDFDKSIIISCIYFFIIVIWDASIYWLAKENTNNKKITQLAPNGTEVQIDSSIVFQEFRRKNGHLLLFIDGIPLLIIGLFVASHFLIPQEFTLTEEYEDVYYKQLDSSQIIHFKYDPNLYYKRDVIKSSKNEFKVFCDQYQHRLGEPILAGVFGFYLITAFFYLILLLLSWQQKIKLLI